jgi:hypothetical protein
MVLELWSIIIKDRMKGIGNVTTNMEKASKNFLTVAHMKAIILMVNRKVWVDILGLMDNFIRASGSME